MLYFLQAFVDFFQEYLLLYLFEKHFLNHLLHLFVVEVQLMMNDYEIHLIDEDLNIVDDVVLLIIHLIVQQNLVYLLKIKINRNKKYI